MTRFCKRGAIGILFAFILSATFATAATWTEYAHDPIVVIGQSIPYMLWNDPTVIKDGSTYRMWISGGSLTNLTNITISVYSAISSDGISWTINPTPAVTPNSNLLAWDGLRIETPSVVKVNGVYHMYYSGTNNANAPTGIYAIGHATSTDGTHWTKDPANPIVTGQFTSPTTWRYQGVGEPGIVYNPANSTFYLYHTGMKYLSATSTLGQVAIFVATSTDGTHFSTVNDSSGQPYVVVTQNVPYAPSGSWFGNSCPAGYVSSVDHKFHLFYDFLVAPSSPNNAQQVYLLDATSTDGVHYSQTETDLFPAGQGNWRNQNVRGPAPLEDNGVLKLWFAGDTEMPVFASGIGYAVKQ